MGELVNLKILDISTYCYDGYPCVELESVPASLSKLTKLERLDLRYNALTALPTELSALTNLESLYLWSNKIEKVFDLSGMTKLHTAWISQDDDALTCLPPLAKGKHWQTETNS